MDELTDDEAGTVPRETVAPVATFPVLQSSPAMMGRDELPRQHSRTAEMPLHRLTVGTSYQIPLAVSEVALRTYVTRENAKGEPQYRVIRWPDCYELGRIK
jgi:hypothetical protein